jgi:shikimate kinase
MAMIITIDIAGPMAVGKTHLARRLSEFLDRELLPSQHGMVRIRTTNDPGRRHWEIERNDL